MHGLALIWAQAEVCQFLNPNAILRFVLSKAELVGLDLVIKKNSNLLKDFRIYFNNQFLAKIRTFRQFLFENPSIGPKVMKNFVLWFKFLPKKLIFGRIDSFDDVTLIFEDEIG